MLYIRARLFYKVQVQTIELENKISSFKKSTLQVGFSGPTYGVLFKRQNLAFFIFANSPV